MTSAVTFDILLRFANSAGYVTFVFLLARLSCPLGVDGSGGECIPSGIGRTLQLRVLSASV